ncbi:EAL domain-containing protein [Jannaschia rubra]|uniref:EAL domain-containing protein n=1 Tax=Jannaschia rubra TaxID=282197 RepID=UPI0011607C92|nr:GGDEF domain-containing phosphodiesterase [Jannaschia rubra]
MIAFTLAVGSAALAAGALGWLAGRRSRWTPVPPPAPLPFPAGIPRPQAPTLALFDLDDLKGVNTGNDFDTGDRLLNAVGDTLRRALPTGAGLERLESGRFLAWMPDMTLDLATEAAERLRNLASQTVVEAPSGLVWRSLSAGVISTMPGESRARAILRADVALTQAKGLGGGRTEAERDLPMPSLTPPREVIETAIATRALEYHVQPIFDLRTNTAAGVEALLRWNRPDGSIMGPGGFMDTLDRIPEAGAELFPDLAVEAATAFVTGPAPIYATFNITGAVLDGAGMPAGRWLDEVTERLPPENLVLEIVESAVIVCPARAEKLLEQMRARGIRIALDDFGSGLSNLERLRRYPVDILKIDRAFVEGLGGAGREEAVLASLVALTSGLDIAMVVEGVETAEQVRTCRDLGIGFAQGFYLGRPAPATEWAARIAGGHSI